MADLTPCTDPVQIGDERYVYGWPCTWHGPIAEAAVRVPAEPCCPHCSGRLLEKPTEAAWWEMIGVGDKLMPGYEAMMRWSQGKCFPDFDILQNAYRQAMEGQE